MEFIQYFRPHPYYVRCTYRTHDDLAALFVGAQTAFIVDAREVVDIRVLTEEDAMRIYANGLGRPGVRVEAPRMTCDSAHTGMRVAYREVCTTCGIDIGMYRPVTTWWEMAVAYAQRFT